MKAVKLLSLLMALIFAVVGLMFIIFPEVVIHFFNQLSGSLGLAQHPESDSVFYPVLAAAYMYLVTVLAFLIYRNPRELLYPFLIAHGKLFSSIMSLSLFIIDEQYLIYLINSIVDGMIGFAAFVYYRKLKREKGA
jgi:hypothetical protein